MGGREEGNGVSPVRNSWMESRVWGARLGARGEAIRVSGRGIAETGVRGERDDVIVGVVRKGEKSQVTAGLLG